MAIVTYPRELQMVLGKNFLVRPSLRKDGLPHRHMVLVLVPVRFLGIRITQKWREKAWLLPGENIVRIHTEETAEEFKSLPENYSIQVCR